MERATGVFVKSILLVVDVQNAFLNDFTRHLPPRIETLAVQQQFAAVLFTRFLNTEGSPYRVILDWHGCAESPDSDLAGILLPLANHQNVYDKLGKTGLPGKLIERLRVEAPDEVVTVGIDTDMCVLKIAMDVFDLGIRPVVLVDCCASTAGLQAHLAGLAVLARNIGADQLRLSGLDEGYLGRPPDEVAPEAFHH